MWTDRPTITKSGIFRVNARHIMSDSMINAEILRKNFSYNPETGVFVRVIGGIGPNARAGSIAGSNDSKGYRKITFMQEFHRAHRLAWLYVYGEWPKHEIDHINGIRSDNRISNLRDIPRARNAENTRTPRKNNKSGLLGVSSPCKHDKKFTASISISGKDVKLGRFDSAEDAHDAYISEKRRLHAGCVI
jgi:hypothetical protein